MLCNRRGSDQIKNRKLKIKNDDAFQSSIGTANYQAPKSKYAQICRWWVAGE